MDDSESVIVFASFDPKLSEVDRVRSILETMVRHTREEPGNEVYDLYESEGSGTTDTRFHLFERYRDGDALEAHRGSDHYGEYRASIGEFLNGPIDVLVLAAIDARG